MLPRELENRLKLFRASRKRQQGSRSDCLRHIRVTHIVRTFNALCVGVPVHVSVWADVGVAAAETEMGGGIYLKFIICGCIIEILNIYIVTFTWGQSKCEFWNSDKPKTSSKLQFMILAVVSSTSLSQF